MIKPVTMVILAYGTKGNITKVRNASAAFLKEENDEAGDECFVDDKALAIYEHILSERWDDTVVLKKPTKSQEGIMVTLPDVHQRMVTEWIQEMVVAKTCVLFASWYSPNDDEHHQMLAADSDKWFDTRDGQ